MGAVAGGVAYVSSLDLIARSFGAHVHSSSTSVLISHVPIGGQSCERWATELGNPTGLEHGGSGLAGFHPRLSGLKVGAELS